MRDRRDGSGNAGVQRKARARVPTTVARDQPEHERPGVLVYSRTSDPKQAQDELSHRAQEDITKKFVESKGYRILPDGIYRDEGTSGTFLKLHKRDGFHAMMDRALTDVEVAAVALYDTSRFARDRVAAATFKAKLRRAGVDILYATQTISNDPDSIIIEALFEAMEEGQSIKTGRLALRGMLQKAKRGDRLGSAPLGYRFETWEDDGKRRSKLVIVPQEAEIVRKIYAEYLRGAGDKGVVEYLHRCGLVTRAGKPFRKGTVEGILVNPSYHGANYFNTFGKGMSFQGAKPVEEWVVVEGAHEAIIPKETWERVQTLRQERNPHVSPPALLGAAHVLSGLLVHETCGAKLIIDLAKGSGGAKKQYRYYTCSTRRTKAKAACEGIRVSADQLEPYVLNSIINQLLSDERVETLFRNLERVRAKLSQDRDRRAAQWARELSRLDAQHERLVTAVADGKMDAGAVRTKLEKIGRERSEVQARIAGLEKLVDVRQLRVTREIVEGLRGTVQGLLEARDNRKTRSFLGKFIEKIGIDKEYITIYGSLEKAVKADQAAGTSYHRLDWLPGQDSNLQPSG